MNAAVAGSVVLVLAVGLAGCGAPQGPPSAAGGPSPTPPATASPSSVTSASPSPPRPLIAILLPAPDHGAIVEWVSAKGQVVAHETFATPKLSAWTNAGFVLQPNARLAAGTIFYVDPYGVIRGLAPDGRVTVITSLQLRPGQNIISFAPSPNGRQVAASILNYPPVHNPPPNNLTDPFLEPGHWWYDYETAAAGGPAIRVVSKDLGEFSNCANAAVGVACLAEPAGVTTVVGWDRDGPVAITDTQLSAQSPPPSSRTPGSALVHLGPDGSHSEQLGGAGCRPLDENSAGQVICWHPRDDAGYPGDFVVTTTAGAVVWLADLRSQGYTSNPLLSPLGDRFCVTGKVYGQAAPPTTLPSTSPNSRETCVGWLDDTTVLLWSSTGELYSMNLSTGERSPLLTPFGTVTFLGVAA